MEKNHSQTHKDKIMSLIKGVNHQFYVSKHFREYKQKFKYNAHKGENNHFMVSILQMNTKKFRKVYSKLKENTQIKNLWKIL
jgi:hypothetical protein